MLFSRESDGIHLALAVAMLQSLPLNENPQFL